MTVSAISNIAIAIGVTEFLGCIFSRKFIFQSDSYTRTVEKFERAKWRRDSTATSLAAKQANPKSQKSAAKEAIKLKREEEELSGLAAEVARRHTMANFYPSIAFIFLYRILASEQSGKLVAILPFQPFNLLQKVTFRGLSTMTAKELNILWLQSKGLDATKILSLDVSNVSQACGFAFIYILCTLSIKKIVNDIFGVRAPEGADGGVATMLDSPQNQKILSSFGVDAVEMKEARKAGKGLGLL